MKKFHIFFVFSFFVCLASYAQDFSLAKKQFGLKEFDKAFSGFEKIAKDQPNYADSRYYMGLISFQKQELGKAEDFLKQAISKDENVAAYHLAIIRVYFQLINEGNMLKKASLASKLKKHMEAAVRLDPNNMNSAMMLIGFYKQAPGFMGGDSDKASALAGEVMKKSRADGHLAYALIAHIDKDSIKAETNYKKASEIQPDSVKYQYSLAQFYFSQKRIDKMLELFEHMFKRFPDNSYLMFQAGRLLAYSDVKFSERGIAYLTQFIQKADKEDTKNIADAYYFLGVIEKNKNNLSSAKGYIQKSLAIRKDHAGAKKMLQELEGS